MTQTGRGVPLGNFFGFVAGLSGLGAAADLLGKLLEATEYNYGYYAQTGEFGDLVKLGIIDPTGRPHGSPGRRVDRGFDRHHRGDCEIRRNPAGDTDLNPATVPI
jgi:hypothetical protein